MARWQGTLQDNEGNAMPGASVEVRRMSDNGLVTLYADEDGVEVAGNPVFADGDGYAFFYVEGGTYKLTAQLGDEQRVWPDVRLGTAQGLDIEDIAEGVVTEPRAGIQVTIDGGGDVIPQGFAVDLEVPFDCDIDSATLLARDDGSSPAGSVVVDILKSTFAAFPPITSPPVGSICASAKPTITTGNKSRDTTLSGWTTALTAGDILTIIIDSVSGITNLTLSLRVTRT